MTIEEALKKAREIEAESLLEGLRFYSQANRNHKLLLDIAEASERAVNQFSAMPWTTDKELGVKAVPENIWREYLYHYHDEIRQALKAFAEEMG